MNEKIDIPAAAKMPEPPNEITLDLRASREARGFSLNDVFCATRVSMNNLTALEGWDFDRLPPPVYTRNFIRKYAQAIGVDEKPILNRYEMHLESLKPPREETQIKEPSPNRWRYFLLFVGLAIAVVAGILVYPDELHDQFNSLFSPAQSGEATPSTQIAPVPIPESAALSRTNSLPETPPVIATTIPAMVSTPAPQAPAAAPLSQDVTKKALHLIIEAKELTWVKITTDHDSPSQALLKPGERIERRASDFFELDIGNAGGIDLTFQGKPLGSIGKRGQVIHNMRLPDKERERKTP